jgi:hypothetical protein
MRITAMSALLLPALVLAACGGPAQQGPASRLTVTVVDDQGTTPRTWTLTCDPPGGDHPRAAAACAAIDAAHTPFAPKPADVACTEIYGGPQTATIEGTWRGEPVRASYRRTDGCEITRWEALAAVLGPGGT